MSMHPQVAEWVSLGLLELKQKPELCVEVGSRILHPHDPHDPRPMVGAAEHIGIDANDGRGVDVVAVAHQYNPPRHADIVLNLQALEHDPFWELSLEACMRWLRPGGVLVVTCAGANTFEHELEHSPKPGHYRNVSSDEVVSVVGPLAERLIIRDVDCVTGRESGSVTWTRTRVIAVKA